MHFDVFISYAPEDKAMADAACAKLEAAGIRCWIAPRDCPPGSEWDGAAVDAIDHCRALVLIFSAHANQSKQVHREVQRAFDSELPVVPFRIENVAAEQSLAYYMGPALWLDALTLPLEQHFPKLVASVKPFAHATAFGEKADEARRSWHPSRWLVLTALVLGAVLLGAVCAWTFSSRVP
jgi:hypothetical protein